MISEKTTLFLMDILSDQQEEPANDRLDPEEPGLVNIAAIFIECVRKMIMIKIQINLLRVTIYFKTTV